MFVLLQKYDFYSLYHNLFLGMNSGFILLLQFFFLKKFQILFSPAPKKHSVKLILLLKC